MVPSVDRRAVDPIQKQVMSHPEREQPNCGGVLDDGGGVSSGDVVHEDRMKPKGRNDALADADGSVADHANTTDDHEPNTVVISRKRHCELLEVESRHLKAENRTIKAENLSVKTALEDSRKRHRELEEESRELRTKNQRMEAAIGTAVDEYLCPITWELPVRPVMAEDGRIYERSAIERLIASKGGDLTSPMTSEPMGPALLPAVQVQNSIDSLVSSGAIAGEKADRWRRQATPLIYPFEADESVFDDACEGFLEVGGAVIAGLDQQGNPIWADDQSSQTSSAAQVDGSTGRMPLKLTIRSDDMDCLEPGQNLNETIIDFFMRWISRKEDPAVSSVHFLPANFFAKLENEGVEAVLSLTANESIDVFTKKFIFLPINETLNWALCVVVNPGHIVNEYMEEEEQQQTDICPIILFFDSLKAISKGRVAAKVRQWLNAEAKRLKKFPEKNAPFQKTTMDVLDPKVPFHDDNSNSWDSGVFVCRYAYSLFLLRNRTFTYEDCGDRAPWFRTAITDSPEFAFNMSDISRLRQELKALVSNLCGSYFAIKDKQIE